MKYSQEEFFRRSRLAIKEISPKLVKMLTEDDTDGFIMVYYVLSRMRLDIIEAMKAIAKDSAHVEEIIVNVENMMAMDHDTMKLRDKIDRLKRDETGR